MALFKTTTQSSFVSTALDAISMPWNAFVAMFLYYVVLTLVAVGGIDVPPVAMAVLYLAPSVAYVAMLLNRAMHALIALPIEIGETPHALQH